MYCRNMYSYVVVSHMLANIAVDKIVDKENIKMYINKSFSSALFSLRMQHEMTQLFSSVVKLTTVKFNIQTL